LMLKHYIVFSEKGLAEKASVKASKFFWVIFNLTFPPTPYISIYN
jgi:hypothetical protein